MARIIWILCLFTCRAQPSLDVFEVDLGSQYGFSSQSSPTIAAGTIQSVIRGAESKNKESLYFLGLLRLYGQGGLSPDAEKAADAIRQAAKLGHVEAQVAFGLLLLHGRGVSRDISSAHAWFRSAATKENTDAQWLLGRLLYEKDGTADWDEAVHWFRKAAKKDSFQAMYYLGLMHEYGHGVALDLRQAVDFYRQAADHKHTPALYNLALMQAYGRGLSQDFSRASILFQEAASKDHAPSMYYLGIMSLYGHGRPIDYQAALRWFENAAARNDESISSRAAEARDEVRVNLLAAKERSDHEMDRFENGGLSEDTIVLDR